MLDTDTKRRIDTARDILVGKVPDPKSQVEQITIALIYKFMDDMDAESEEFGGKRKFFAGEFARYGWAKLMHSGLGGHETRISGIPFEGKSVVLKEQVAAFFEVTPRTVDNYIEKYGDELRQNGYEVLRGNRLKTLKLEISAQGDNETDFVIKTNVLDIFGEA